MIQNGQSPSIDDVQALLCSNGHRPILLFIRAGKKGPEFQSWQNVQYVQTQARNYQARLRSSPNTGVLLGSASDNLCAIDCDTEVFLEALLAANPSLTSTLRTHGARGGQIWAYITGSRPKKTYKLKVSANSPLAVGAANPPDEHGMVQIGEFRAEGAQSVIRGVHPAGMEYVWSCAKTPVEIDFDRIVWPYDVAIPWDEGTREPSASTGSEELSLLKRAIERLSIDFLWKHFGFPERHGNPVRSPFREDEDPSFSVYDQGRRFKDHGYDPHRGDSFNFYQIGTKSNSRAAFKPFVTLAGLGDELTKSPKSSAQAVSQTQKPELILPSGPVTFTNVAHQVFPVLAKRQRYFVRERLLVEVAYNKSMKDRQLHDCFQLLEPDAFRSRIEEDFTCFVWREERGQYILKPSRCTADGARTLLKTDAALEHLPAISFLSAQPVLTAIDGNLAILGKGYHEAHGGIYVTHGDQQIVMPELGSAQTLLWEVLKDYDFVSESDKSRAIASLLSPALRAGKLLGDADFPIDIAEADQSQSGKTFRLKLICAIYGETPYVIANREGGVGSLDESISGALLAGIPFIMFENFRGRMDSQLIETCLRGFGTAPARIPYRGEVQVPTTHINWQLSSNGMESTRDLVNRAVINRISKHAAGYKFATYPEGNILAHVKVNQAMYLGAVFRIIKEWHDLGCPRTDENRHDFMDWAQSLDWIVQNIFGLAPLLDGHTEEVLRVSDPALSWLRQVAIAAKNDNRLDEGLSPSDILDICEGRGIEFPGKVSTTNPDQLAMYVGRLLSRIFRETNETIIDRYKVCRESRVDYRQGSRGEGHQIPYTRFYYWFEIRKS
jgi:hypothetical protein